MYIMDVKKIVIGVVILVLLYLVYTYFFSSSAGQTTLVNMHDATKYQVIPATSLPGGNSTDYTYSIWLYINDWNYRYGESKVIFGRLDSNNEPAPSMTLDPINNNLNVSLAVYSPSDTVSHAKIHTCSLENVPLQRWTNVIMSLNSRALDIYMDGKLVRTCVLPGLPKPNPSSDLQLTPSGGFSGNTSGFVYLPNAINPTQAYNLYKGGYGGGSMMGNLFNKYRIKLAFVQNNKEVNSFEL